MFTHMKPPHLIHLHLYQSPDSCTQPPPPTLAHSPLPHKREDRNSHQTHLEDAHQKYTKLNIRNKL